MKKLLVAFVAVFVAATTYGQGQVDFNNLVQGDTGAPIWLPGGTQGPGAGFTAQLFVVNGSDYTSVGSTTFLTDAGFEQYLNPVTLTLDGIAPGASATFAVRVWADSFDTYELAESGNGLRGQSQTFTQDNIGGGLNPPSNLTGLTSFELVPEPSTIALGLIGAGALLLRRRK